MAERTKQLPDLEASYQLIIDVYRLAIRDAKKGDAKAASWLDYVAPDWRERCNRQMRGKCKGVAQSWHGKSEETGAITTASDGRATG